MIKAFLRVARQTAGFTIIELIVTMVIVALLGIAVVVPLGGLLQAELKTSAGKLAASVRYLQNLSVINNQSYRLVLDLNENSYWAEELPKAGKACEAFLLDFDSSRKDITQSEFRKLMRDKEKQEEAIRDGEALPSEAASEASFSKIKDNLLSRRKLPKRIQFQKALVSHHMEPVEEGQVAINFFPAGYVERAFIYIGDEDNTRTIETKPLLGTAEIHSEALPHSRFIESR